MIDVALKYYIYDMCINLFFNNVRRNFSVPKDMTKFSPTMFHVFEQYACIKTYRNKTLHIFYECSIDKVYEYNLVFCHGYSVKYGKDGERKVHRPVSSSNNGYMTSSVEYKDIIETSQPSIFIDY